MPRACLVWGMTTDGIEKLLKLRHELEGSVAQYIEQLDSVYTDLKNEAQSFLDGLKSTPQKQLPLLAPEQTNLTAVSPVLNGSWKSNSKSDTLVIAELIDKIDSPFSASDMIRLTRKAPIQQGRVRTKAVRRIVSRIATVENSPLELLEKGHGNVPNVYRRIRPVVPELQRISQWHRQQRFTGRD